MLWACLRLPSLPLDVFARALAPETAARAARRGPGREAPRGSERSRVAAGGRQLGASIEFDEAETAAQPFAVTTGGHYPRIVIANAAAYAAAVAPGQLVSASLALAPDIVLRDRDPALEAAALASVAGWATQFTPTVSLAPPDAVLSEIGGSLRLFGGLRRLTAELARGAHDLGYATQLSLAPTPLAALMLARAGNPGLAASARDAHRHFGEAERATLAAALAPLPLAHLDVAPDIVATLAAAGVTTFGEACSLPRAPLARRVGAGFVALLDRACGLVPDPRPPFVSPPRYEGRLELPAPVADVEALAFAAHRLVRELAGWLAGRGLGVLELALSLAHGRYISTSARVALAAPSREPAHLIGVLRERLARIELPAPAEAVVLASAQVAPLAGRNLGLLPGDEAVASVPLVDRLRARLGDDAVTRIAPRAEHRPERANECDVASPSAPGSRRSGAEADMAFPPRPVWLLAEPAPLGEIVEAQPWVLRDGPERIESGWWDGADVRRDYFVAATPRGELAWIYRDHRYGIDDGEWFLHGLFA
ncbi:MAG TPA: DNA polymerase Y family protein [Casimicrobiaceae bacterium]|nr:DNA polymerase Y family protein [Casimicrobiaceae bacterium]